MNAIHDCNFFSQGIPTHDASGKELSKSSRKNLIKQYEKQEKLYNGKDKKTTNDENDDNAAVENNSTN